MVLLCPKLFSVPQSNETEEAQFSQELQIVSWKIFIQCLHNVVCSAARILVKFIIILHQFFLFKENSSSDGGLQAEDEGAVLSVQDDDPGNKGDEDSFGLTNHTTKLLDEAPPKSVRPVRRQPSLTCGETVVRRHAQKCSCALFSEKS